MPPAPDADAETRSDPGAGPSPETPLRVTAAQIEPRLGCVAENLERMIRLAGMAARAGSTLIVFPECALTGYCFASREEAMEVAEPFPGPSVARLAEVCRESSIHVAFGMLERDGDRLYNAAALVGPDGPIGSYRKIHLPFLGVDAFADPGDRPFAVHSLLGGALRVGMHICYDGSFPESGRVLALLGADLLLLPTNWPTRSECAAEHLAACRAHENVVYAMAVNRVGSERGFQFIGRSSIADPSGTLLARAGAVSEELLHAEIVPALARRKRLVRVPGKHEIDRFRDRRPEFYAEITRPDPLFPPGPRRLPD